MFFFEGKIELFNVLILGVFPVVIPVLMYFNGRKRLWLSPLVALAVGLITTAVFYPYFFADILKGGNDTTTGYWLFFIVPAHFVISAVVTAFCYLIDYFRKRRK